MKFFLKFTNNQRKTPVDYEENEKVINIKEGIMKDNEDINDIKQIKIIFRGKILKNFQSIKNCKIKENNTVIILANV